MHPVTEAEMSPEPKEESHYTELRGAAHLFDVLHLSSQNGSTKSADNHRYGAVERSCHILK